MSYKRPGAQAPEGKGEIKMTVEVVKVVKGYEITRMKGFKGCYHINIREGNGFKEYLTFKTIKAAVEFIEKVL